MVSERVPPVIRRQPGACGNLAGGGRGHSLVWLWGPRGHGPGAEKGCASAHWRGRREAAGTGGRWVVLACPLMAQFRGLSLNSVTPNLFSSISQLNPGLCLLPASRSCCSCEVPWTETGSRHQPGHPTVGHSSGCGAPAPQPQARTINRTAKQTA